MKLYSAWYCPFAQRAWLSLLYKDVDFEYVEVDPYKKTKQWMEISRQTGQVPVLALAKGQAVVDSSRVVEFIDHSLHNINPLFSDDPLENAEQKFWIDFINKKIVPYFYRFLKNPNSTDIGRQAKQKMLEGIIELSQAMNQTGTFFYGDKITAVDIAFSPFAYRIELLLKYYRDFELPVDDKIWQRYSRWYNTNIEQAEFRETVISHSQNSLADYNNRLIEFYLPYSQGDGQQDVTNL